MKFSKSVRKREAAFIIRLLTIFGVVEQRQMRLLFGHMDNCSYHRLGGHSGNQVRLSRVPAQKRRHCSPCWV